MLVYPAIEVMDGQCVSLRRGDIRDPVFWGADPLDCARRYAGAGAEWLHLVDFDAIMGESRNAGLVLSIIRQVGIPVQLAGGFRSTRQIEEWIELGAARIVVGTLAVQNQDWVKQMAKLHPDQIVVAVDVWRGGVMISGWTETSAISAELLIRSFELVPLAGFIVTDIDASLGEQERSLALINSLAELTSTPVIASGLVHALDDVSRLKYASTVSGCIVGSALLDKSVELEDVLALAQPVPESRAKFI